MDFHVLAQQLHEIGALQSRLVITRHIAELFQKARPDEVRIITYMLLGELRPAYQGGTQFNLAERSLVQVVMALFGCSADDIVAMQKEKLDLADVVMHGTWIPSTERTVQEVYADLQAISMVAGVGSQEERLRRLTDLLRSVHPLDATLIVRIVLGKLRLGFSDMTVVDAISWLLVSDKSARDVVERAYNIRVDLGEIAEIARRDGLPALKDIHIHLGVPIRPAAAERLGSAQDIFEKLGPCVVQPKLDGFRVQVHVKEGQILWFSRNLQPLENMFPELEAELQKWNLKGTIFEGEAIAFNEETGEFLPFQETVKRRRKHDVSEVAESYPLRLVLFDLLYYEGVEFLNKPHFERYAQLQALTQHEHSVRIVCIDERKIESADTLERYFLEVVEQGLEGIIAKRDDAIYQAGKRNFNWIKLKRQMMGKGLEDTIDVVILGYYYGRGKRAAFGIGALLVGVYDETQDRYVTIAKIGTGMTDEQWVTLRELCDKASVREQPHNVVCSKNLIPNVWTTPEVVIEVAADEITRSPVHSAARSDGTGLALRFPRMIQIRTDKSAREVTTVAEVVALYRQQRQE